VLNVVGWPRRYAGFSTAELILVGGETFSSRPPRSA
jgi:hypothetical protein